MINRDGTTCRNNNHFEHPTILNAPWDEHSMMFFKSVADLCFTGPFAVLGKAKYQYRPLHASTDGRYQTYYLPCFVDKHTNTQTDRQTDKQTDDTKRIISPASRSIMKWKSRVFLLFHIQVLRDLIMDTTWAGLSSDRPSYYTYSCKTSRCNAIG